VNELVRLVSPFVQHESLVLSVAFSSLRGSEDAYHDRSSRIIGILQQFTKYTPTSRIVSTDVLERNRQRLSLSIVCNWFEFHYGQITVLRCRCRCSLFRFLFRVISRAEMKPYFRCRGVSEIRDVGHAEFRGEPTSRRSKADRAAHNCQKRNDLA
jgi:hypothetical protein